MARIRTIKPDFFTSETVAALPLSARLLFIGLWTYVDDNGVGLDNTKLVNAAIWPLEDDPSEALRRVEVDLHSLAERKLIVRYKGHDTQGNEKQLLFVSGWDEHQNISHPKKSRYSRPTNPTPEEQPSSSKDDKESHPAPESSGEPPEALRKPSGDSPEDVPKSSVWNREQGTGNNEDSLRSSSSSAIASRPPDPPPRDDVERICDHLADRIETNGANRPAVTRRWRNAARLMLDSDGRTEQQIHTAIAWCQDDDFWRGNILSLPKLREKYDQLRLHAKRQATGRSRASPPDDLGTDAHFERAMQRALAREAAMNPQGGSP